MAFSVISRMRRRKSRKTRPPADSQPPSRRKRRWWWLGSAIVLLLAVVLLLPSLVARTPLLHWILAKAAADLDGRITVRSASLGWFSAVAAEGIEVRDSQDRPVLEADALQGDTSLAALLWNMSALGQIELQRPKLNVVLRPDGSNVEDVLAKYLAPSEEPRPKIGLALKIVDGSVSLTDQDSKQSWQIEQFQLALKLSADGSEPMQVEASGNVAGQQRPGRFALTLSMPPPGAGRLTVDTTAVPLEMFNPLLGRFAPQTQLAGSLSSKINTQWDADAADGRLSAEADVAADGFALAAPPLGEDRVQLQQLRAACRMAGQNGRVEIAQSSLDCELGHASLSGTLDLGGEDAGPSLASVLKQRCEINGRVDLARLAAMLPNTLRIRQETEVTSGQVQLALSSWAEPQGMVWQGRIAASDLLAVHRGRQLSWQQPVVLTLAVRDSQAGPVVENLECESDFLKLHAAGTPDALSASASFSLEQLADQLGQFVDLSGVNLGGNGWAQLSWKRSAQQQFETDAELQLRNFQFTLPGQQPWIEENLAASLEAAGQTDLGAETRLQRAALKIQTATDRIDAQLAQPVPDLGGAWPIRLNVQGQLQRWLPRLQTWLPTKDLAAVGTYDLAAQVTGSTDQITVNQAKLTVSQLQVRSPWVNLDEPRTELVLEGSWNRAQRKLEIAPASLASYSLALEADRVVLAMPEEGPSTLTGTLKYQGDLKRLQPWFTDPKKPAAWLLAGRLAGSAQLAQSAGRTDVQMEANVDNFAVSNASGEKFAEPKVHLIARGQYEHQSGILQLDQAQLTSDVLGGDLTGRVTPADDQTNLQLAGQVQYDMAKLSELLRPYLGPGVQIVGQGKSPISYAGPLSPAEAQAEAAFGWQRADIYGFPVGPGELKARLAQGVLAAEPMKLQVSGGQMSLAPRLKLADGPMELTLPPGPLATQVQITPQMCTSALKYIAPVLAGVTMAEGRFSVEMQGCRIPLADPAQGELAGRLTVHSVQVGPGPLVRELAVLLGRAAPATLRRESAVDFRMVRGRVYHQGLELTFPDLTIRTYGSVGLDQTLALMAEMPIPPKWLGHELLAKAMTNQTIRLPIGGTLSQPKIDRRELERLSSQFIERAARNVLGNEVGRQLDSLFGRPQ